VLTRKGDAPNNVDHAELSNHFYLLLHNSSSMATNTTADVDPNRREILDVPELRHGKKWWFQDPGLRKLYFLIFIAILSSATNGYDGYVMLQSSLIGYL
jgi:hypothetical protein